MQVYNELNHNPNLSLCLGFFDGVHEGHKVVLKNAVNLAKQNGIKSAVVTFKDHPLCYFQSVTPSYIVSLEDRLKLIDEQGIDYAYVLDFDDNIADSLAYDYIKDFLVKNFEPKFITTGFNHYFGANKQGDVSFLRNHQAEFGYKYYEIPPISFNNTLISSSKIRQLISLGDVDLLPNLLGGYFNITANVVKGKQIGRTLSFPTANIKFSKGIITPKKGVYAVRIKIDGKTYNAMANFGMRPTVGGEKLLLEVYVLDFDGNLYDKAVNVSFMKRIRDEVKFSSLPELKSQLVKDEIEARHFFCELTYK